MATTALPFIFPYVKTEDKILIDGGIFMKVDI